MKFKKFIYLLQVALLFSLLKCSDTSLRHSRYNNPVIIDDETPSISKEYKLSENKLNNFAKIYNKTLLEPVYSPIIYNPIIDCEVYRKLLKGKKAQDIWTLSDAQIEQIIKNTQKNNEIIDSATFKLINDLTYLRDLINQTENIEHLRTFMPEIIRSYGKLTPEELIKIYIPSHRNALFIKYENKVVGTIDIHSIDQTDSSAHIAIWITKNYEGRGITTFAICNYLNDIFKQNFLNKIYYCCDWYRNEPNRQNISSAKTAESLRFEEIKYDPVKEFNMSWWPYPEPKEDSRVFVMTKERFLKNIKPQINKYLNNNS